MAGRRLVL